VTCTLKNTEFGNQLACHMEIYNSTSQSNITIDVKKKREGHRSPFRTVSLMMSD
jgi:hypothetical protein